jgi:hypothetical protein
MGFKGCGGIGFLEGLPLGEGLSDPGPFPGLLVGVGSGVVSVSSARPGGGISEMLLKGGQVSLGPALVANIAAFFRLQVEMGFGVLAERTGLKDYLPGGLPVFKFFVLNIL